MHEAHGANGRAFTDKEAQGEYEAKEEEMPQLYKSTALEIISERITLDQGVQSIAKASKRASSQVRESLLIMIDTIKEKNTDMAEQKAAIKAKKTKPAAKGERRRLEHVEGDEFARVRDEYGLSNKQAAEATGEAGMGASATYIYILTHQGSSIKLFEKYQAALKTYAKSNKIRRPKAAVAEGEPVEEPAAQEATSAEEAPAEPEPELVGAVAE